MPGPWCSTADVSEAVRTQIGVDEMDPRWAGIIPPAVGRAWQTIQTALLNKGYTLAQMDAWDFRRSHNLDLATVKSLINGGSLTGYDLEPLMQRERLLLDEIKSLPALSVNGVLVFPAATTADGGGLVVSGGDMDQCGWRVNRDTEF